MDRSFWFAAGLSLALGATWVGCAAGKGHPASGGQGGGVAQPSVATTATSNGGSVSSPMAIAPGSGGAGAAQGSNAMNGGGGASSGSGGAPASSGGGTGGASSGGGTGAGGSAGTAGGSGLRAVLLVGNSVSGSVSVLDAQSFANLGSVNVIPDLQDRLSEINGNPLTAIGYSGVKQGQVVKHFEPSGGDRFVDDVFASPDGNTLYVSRSNLGDVAAFDLSSAAHTLLWHTHVDGLKADHATLSPDGTRLVVSATTADKADVLDAKTGMIVTSFPTGHYPHQNDYSADGKHLYNGSIGDVSLPHAQDTQKGVRQVTVVDAQTFQVVKTYPFMEGIRPTVITADEKLMYSQQSYLNGLIEFDLGSGMIVKTLDEPLSDFAKMNYPTPDDYPHDSAHHGLAMSGDGSKLCDCGTIDNTVSIVATADLTVTKVIDVGLIPYWATTSPDGKTCFVSLSGDGVVSVIDYDKAAQVMQVKVGTFPQRSRIGRLTPAAISALAPSGG
jgi:DNA-binding beta-propeller fold protein YncE